MAMTLKARLARLEKMVAPISEGVSAPPGLVAAVVFTVAVVFGGYPQPREGLCERDSVGDAFARALGYLDRDALEKAGINERTGRQSEVLSALCREYGSDLNGAPPEDTLRICVRAMTAAGHDVSSPSFQNNAFRSWASAVGVFLEVLRAQALRHPIGAAPAPHDTPLGVNNTMLPAPRQNHG